MHPKDEISLDLQTLLPRLLQASSRTQASPIADIRVLFGEADQVQVKRAANTLQSPPKNSQLHLNINSETAHQ